jgi:hypothetical protein
MLTRWHYIALAAPLLLLAIEWRRMRTGVIVIVFAAILFAAFEALIDIRLHAMRMSGDRRFFGMLHGISSLLLIGQVLCAAGAVAAIERDDHSPSPPPSGEKVPQADEGDDPRANTAPHPPSASGDRVPVDVELVDREP